MGGRKFDAGAGRSRVVRERRVQTDSQHLAKHAKAPLSPTTTHWRVFTARRGASWPPRTQYRWAVSAEAPRDERVRAAEVIGALCLATDLGMGFPFEHGLHSTLVPFANRWSMLRA